MPNVSISPVYNGFQFFDNLGQPLNGGKLFQYEAGSNSVQRTTYADDTGTTPNSNPIVLDSSGRLPTDLWLVNGLAYNLVLTAPDGTTVLNGVDNVIGVVPSTTGGNLTTAIWTITANAPTYVSPTQFLLPGNETASYALNNRVQAQLAVGTFVYGTVSAVQTTGGNTQVTLVMDGATLTSALSQVAWSVNVSNGRTVDAGAVAYNSPTTYNSSNTVGYQIKNTQADLTTLTNAYGASQRVWPTSGTNTYTVTISPPITSYSVDQIFTIKFVNANTGPSTLNINGVGAVPLTTRDVTGASITPILAANEIATVAYNGTGFVVLTGSDIPSTAGNSGKYLTNNGIVSSWASLGDVIGNATDGRVQLGNLLIQWGTTPAISYGGIGGSGTAITFAVPFGTCYNVQATRIGNENQSGNKRDDHSVLGVTNTGFTMWMNYENMNPTQFYWLAIGSA